MQARLRMSVAALFAVSCFVLLVFTMKVGAAIVVDNDVVIEWLDGNNRPINASVVGAPRLVSDWSSVRITVDIPTSGRVSQVSQLILSFYSLDLCRTTQCPPPVILSFEEVPAGGFSLAEHFHVNTNGLPTPGILTVAGLIHVSGPVPARQITVSGDGDPIFIDRIGDDDHFHPGDASDVPTRSIELMRALNQIETSLLSTHAVELDSGRSPGAEIVVGGGGHRWRSSIE